MKSNDEARWLIVNADDFGLHSDINRAIEQAHQNGVLTSTSLVACGLAFDQAVQIAQDYPQLDVGVHLTLVEERPLSPADTIDSLLSKDGSFWKDHRILSGRLLTGQVSLAEVRSELTAQVERILAAGIQPTHLDSHQHVHLLPGIWPVVVDLAHQFGIKWIRAPHFTTLTKHTSSSVEPFLRLGLNLLSKIHRQQLNDLYCAQHSLGFDLSGRLNQDHLLSLLRNLPTGISEIITHPGFTTPSLEGQYSWNYGWTGEYEALVASQIKQVITETNIKLTGFSGIPYR